MAGELVVHAATDTTKVVVEIAEASEVVKMDTIISKLVAVPVLVPNAKSLVRRHHVTDGGVVAVVAVDHLSNSIVMTIKKVARSDIITTMRKVTVIDSVIVKEAVMATRASKGAQRTSVARQVSSVLPKNSNRRSNSRSLVRSNNAIVNVIRTESVSAVKSVPKKATRAKHPSRLAIQSSINLVVIMTVTAIETIEETIVSKSLIDQETLPRIVVVVTNNLEEMKHNRVPKDAALAVLLTQVVLIQKTVMMTTIRKTRRKRVKKTMVLAVTTATAIPTIVATIPPQKEVVATTTIGLVVAVGVVEEAQTPIITTTMGTIVMATRTRIRTITMVVKSSTSLFRTRSQVEKRFTSRSASDFLTTL